MQAYSMDLRERALLDSDAGMKAADVAVKYRVSGSWVRLLKQRRRETGDVAPRVQRHGRRRMLEPHLHTLAALIAEQPDRTLAELKDALGTPASLATIWRAVAALDVTVKKNGPALRTRADGADLEGADADAGRYGCGCRVYEGDGGNVGWPSVARVRQSLQRARRASG